jgi:hypothetical protein
MKVERVSKTPRPSGAEKVNRCLRFAAARCESRSKWRGGRFLVFFAAAAKTLRPANNAGVSDGIVVSVEFFMMGKKGRTGVGGREITNGHFEKSCLTRRLFWGT